MQTVTPFALKSSCRARLDNRFHPALRMAKLFLALILVCAYCVSCASCASAPESSPFEKAILRELRETSKDTKLILRELRENSKDMKVIRSILKQSLKPYQNCRKPYQKVDKMCLMLHKTELSWYDASKFCKKHDGFLVWLYDQSEHEAARKFVANQMGGTITDKYWYWTGLHRSGKVLQWQGYKSSYRGAKLVDPNYGDCFFAEAHRRSLEASKCKDGYRTLCRRFWEQKHPNLQILWVIEIFSIF